MANVGALMEFLKAEDLIRGRLIDRHVPSKLQATKRKFNRSKARRLNKISFNSRRTNW